jgi:protoporphyrinogen oxidase
LSQKIAIIIGAGPAGLTAAHELLTRTDIKPVVLEMEDCLGGISRTVNHKGNRMDIGGHRFFSKSDRVMQWWLEKLPLQQDAEGAMLTHQGQSRPLHADAARRPTCDQQVMLLRQRKSRIYFLRKFFDYPLRLNADTVLKLGLFRTGRIGGSYAWAALFGPRHPQNLEQFFISRFGRQLYLLFFRSYTEKVWGRKCTEISAEWGAQRIKGLSIATALRHLLGKLFGRKDRSVAQKDTETSLIEQFLYPKYGPGQMWETVAAEVRERGGEVICRQKVVRLHVDGERITAVDAIDLSTGQEQRFHGDYFFSTMPVRDLIESLDTEVPQNVREVSAGLPYRDFIAVGLLLKKLKVHENGSGGPQPVRDNWIYIQEPDVQLGRLQVFNNWSPYMVADPGTFWLGLEYFCYETDEIWNKPDEEMIALAAEELARIGIIDPADVLDGTVVRVAKTYPAYFGAYARFAEIRQFVDRFANLFLIGRNGMHRYNNQDHSMLTAMVAVDNICRGEACKASIWDVNTEQEYHESKSR